MRIQLTWPNAAATGLTLSFVLPDFTSDSLRPALRRALAYAGPVLDGMADAAGAGLLARLMLPLAVDIMQQSLENPVQGSRCGPAGVVA